MKKKSKGFKTEFPSEATDLSDKYIWQIWIVRFSGYKSDIRLVYSWVVPSTEVTLGWEKPAIRDSISYNYGNNLRNTKVDFLQTSYYGSGQSIKDMILGLMEGKLLSEVQNHDESNLPNEFINLKLGNSSAEVKLKYVLRPEVFLPMEHLLIPWPSKALPSPTDYSLFLTQVFLLDKDSALNFETDEERRRVVLAIRQMMKTDTGFDFGRSSAPRIGNIDWFRLPFSKASNEPLASFYVLKDEPHNGRSIKVQLTPNEIQLVNKTLLVRVRLVNGEEITLDEVREISINTSGVDLLFTSNEPISEVFLTIWINSDGRSKIVYEENKILIRSMSFSMSMVGLRVNTGKINLLKNLRSTEKDEADAMASFDRSTSVSTSDLGDYEDDPWVASSRHVLKAMAGIIPDKSDGEFFVNGWNEDTDETGHFSFFKWILNVVSTNHRRSLILIDPFFDHDGIEIFAHTRTTNAKYTILTCTQHREKEVEGEKESVEPHAATKIKSTCRNALPLLQGLDLQIQDLRSVKGGKTQLFHDRYIILTDNAGIPSIGFHLSNSIQGATKRAPLLITPIPGDVLPEVLDYINSLITPSLSSDSRDTKLVQLYPFTDEGSSRPKKRIERPSLFDSDYAFNIETREIITLLTSDDTTSQLNEFELVNKLRAIGLMEAKNDTILLYKIDSAKISLLAQHLAKLNAQHFIRFWTALGDILANSHHIDYNSRIHANMYDAWDCIKNEIENYPSLSDRLVNIVSDAKVNPALIRNHVRVASIFEDSRFEEIIERTFRKIIFDEPNYFSANFGLTYGIEILVSAFPTKAMECLKILAANLNSLQWNEADDNVKTKHMIISFLFQQIISFQHRKEKKIMQSLIADENLNLRAIGAATIGSNLIWTFQNSLPFEEVIGNLKLLPREEYQLTLAAIIAEKYSDKTFCLKLIEEIIDGWKGDEHIVRRVVKVLSGRLYPNHTEFITINFLSPLVNKKVISKLFPITLWQEILVKKIEFSSETKLNHSSENDFSPNTDIELTNTILGLLKELSGDEQDRIIKEWFNSIESIWPILRQPFAQFTGYKGYSDASTRIYWVQLKINTLLNKCSLAFPAADTAKDFVSTHRLEIDEAVNFMISRPWSIAHQIKATNPEV